MLDCQRDKFDLPEHISYLNTSYMSPSLRSVAQAGHAAIDQKLRPYEIRPADFFSSVEKLKESYATLIHTDDPQRIVPIPSVSYGIATVANNVTINAGQHIIVVEDQFPSNIYSWTKLAERTGATIKIIPKPESMQYRGRIWNEHVLEAINEQTALVALPHVHWSEGILFDLQRIRKKTKQVNALLVIDGTQSVGAYPFSIADIKPDALICGGYKWLLGGYSLGLAYFGEAFDNGEPIEENWINRKNSQDFSGLVNYEPDYQEKANRYAMGEKSNFVLVPMLQTAITQLNEWGVENIQAYCRALIKDFQEEVRTLGFDFPDQEQIASHLFAVQIPQEIDISQLKQLLEDAHLYLSIRGNNLRIATHLFNTKEDLEKLLTCLKKVSEGLTV